MTIVLLPGAFTGLVIFTLAFIIANGSMMDWQVKDWQVLLTISGLIGSGILWTHFIGWAIQIGNALGAG